MSPEALKHARPPSSSPRSETRCVIPADHPSLAGHFPGNPIVPAVVILDEVLRAFAAWRPEHPPVGMPVVKFLAPLQPEQAFTIRFIETKGPRFRFECLREDGQRLAQGCLLLSDGDQ